MLRQSLTYALGCVTAVVLAAVVLAFGPGPLVPVAHACGGGLVTTERGGTASDAQRIFLAVGEMATEVVTVVEVPRTESDFGVLLPVPAVPVLDGAPVPVEEIDQLVRQTGPRITVVRRTSPASDDGCDCVPGGGDKVAAGTPGSANPRIGSPVAIGPITAVVLDGSAEAPLSAWLRDNGFALPAAHAPLIAAYVGPGRAFIALRRRSDATTAGAPARVGVHFTLPGDQRGLPLRFGRLGAGAMAAYTVFVVAPTPVATALPFETLGLQDLDASTLGSAGYDAALAQLVGSRRGLAFVAEGAHRVSELVGRGELGPRLQAWSPPGHTLTRLSTRMASDMLETDVEFTVPAERAPENSRTVLLNFFEDEGDAGRPPRGPGSAVWLGLAGLCTVAAFRLRARRTRAPAVARAPMLGRLSSD